MRTNRERTIPRGFEQLGQAGNLANFRLAAGAHGRYRAIGEEIGVIFPFLDTDVYKWLEAAGWELGRAPDPALARDADEAIDLIAAAQRPDGYLNTFVQVVAPGPRVRGPGMGPRALFRGPPDPGGRRVAARARRRPAPPGRDPGGRFRRPRARPGGPPGDRRPPGDRDGAGRAVPDDRRASLPRARRTDGRGARRRAARDRSVRPGLLAGPRARARGTDRGRPCGSSAVPRLRRGGRRDRAGRHPAARCRRAPLARHGGDADVPDRRPRQPPRRRVVRGPVRAAARPRLRRDLCRDRERHARLAAPPRDRGAGLRRRRRADDLQRRAVRACPSTGRASSTSTRCSDGPTEPRPSRAAASASPGMPAPAARRT